MTLVETVTVGSGGAASIVFSAIPPSATDLVIKLSARSTQSAPYEALKMRFNTGGTYLSRFLEGDGVSRTSSTSTDGWIGYISGSTSTSNTFGNAEIYIPNYTSSNSKTATADTVGENNTSDSPQHLFAFSWSGTSAITSVTLSPNSYNFAQHSTASLYIVTKGSGGATVS
jgi:hypothetical protein